MFCEENQESDELQDIYFPFKAQSQTSRSVFLKPLHILNQLKR